MVMAVVVTPRKRMESASAVVGVGVAMQQLGVVGDGEARKWEEE